MTNWMGTAVMIETFLGTNLPGGNGGRLHGRLECGYDVCLGIGHRPQAALIAFSSAHEASNALWADFQISPPIRIRAGDALEDGRCRLETSENFTFQDGDSVIIMTDKHRRNHTADFSISAAQNKSDYIDVRFANEIALRQTAAAYGAGVQLGRSGFSDNAAKFCNADI